MATCLLVPTAPAILPPQFPLPRGRHSLPRMQLDDARLERARQRHAGTERRVQTDENTASQNETVKVLGERPWAGNASQADADMGWEPMAPPSHMGIASSNGGYFAVFALLAGYALVGMVGYLGGLAAITLALGRLVEQLGPQN